MKRIGISTSLRPTRRIRSFCKDLQVSIPNSVYLTRGKSNIYELSGRFAEVKCGKFMVINRWKGGPGIVDFYQINEGLIRLNDKICIGGIKLRREFKTALKLPPVNRLLYVVTDELSDEGKHCVNFLVNFLEAERYKEGEEGLAIQFTSHRKHLLNAIFVKTPEFSPIGPAFSIKFYRS